MLSAVRTLLRAKKIIKNVESLDERYNYFRVHSQLLGGGSSSHSDGTRSSATVVTRLELHKPLAAWT